ncbi:hypothetical protein TREES_T100021056 [Tupaia chinensis]|uniref:Uncharacterized protein n=1 Tax=Tupaia chinensis TaxID=246437 RepID=L9JA44_TUPCH|nr:hypothetical protein TREES_T100021056 [Tupaia chinensis]
MRPLLSKSVFRGEAKRRCSQSPVGMRHPRPGLGELSLPAQLRGSVLHLLWPLAISASLCQTALLGWSCPHMKALVSEVTRPDYGHQNTDGGQGPAQVSDPQRRVLWSKERERLVVELTSDLRAKLLLRSSPLPHPGTWREEVERVYLEQPACLGCALSSSPGLRAVRRLCSHCPGTVTPKRLMTETQLLYQKDERVRLIEDGARERQGHVTEGSGLIPGV